MTRRHVLLLAGLVAAAGCSDDNGQGPGTPEGDILVRNNSFDPTALTVETGETVTWAWAADAVTHNVTFLEGDVTSGNRSSGTFERTFDAAGEYAYRCTIHVGMAGTVTVEDAPAADTGGNPGDRPGGY